MSSLNRRFSTDELRDWNAITSKEWLETNGTGSYAASTLCHCHTRKYHGLLVVRCATPPGKYVLLSKMEEFLVGPHRELPVSTNQYPNAVYPNGHEFLHAVDTAPVPSFHYRWNDSRKPTALTKQVAMVQGADTTLVRYTATRNPHQLRLRVRPLLAFRNFHALQHENVDFQVRTFPAPGGFKIQPYSHLPPLFVQAHGPVTFFPSPLWYKNVEYLREFERGFSFREDLFSPGVFECAVTPDAPITLAASTCAIENIDGLWEGEIQRRKKANATLRGTAAQKRLKRAARQFLTVRPDGNKAVVAGYPWFLEWGRDALIALPDLLLTASNDVDTYIDVLRGFASCRRNGVIPNFLSDGTDGHAYNSVDASLWFVAAVQRIATTASMWKKLDAAGIVDAVTDILTRYAHSDDALIRTGANGLVATGTPTSQYTWMDATVDGKGVTPRCGYPVEINALWYNALCFIAAHGDRFPSGAARTAAALRDAVGTAFAPTFWMPHKGYLADVVHEDGTADDSLRPNQLLAVSLPHSPLTRSQAQGVVQTVVDHLYTPVGLRTLASFDPRYRGRYVGTAAHRDAAYHNGTAWPWLLVPFVDALAAVEAPALSQRLAEISDHLSAHLDEAGIDSISEIFDGDPPHTPRGCTAQAWSVAAALHVLDMARRASSPKAAQRKRVVTTDNRWRDQ